MTTSIIGVFDAGSVRQVVNDLVAAGLERRAIAILEGDRDEIRREVLDRGFDEADAGGMAAAAASGKAVVAAEVSEASADRMAKIMDRHEAGEGDEEHEEAPAGKETAGRKEKVQVVEERLALGRRQVLRGGMRVTSRVAERPVEASVTLREERVEADRKPADRVLSQKEADAAFSPKTVEMTETAEELEVNKEAHLIEEVSLTKQVSAEDRTVHETVRHTEVDVERLRPGGARKAR